MNDTNREKVESILDDYTFNKKYGELVVKFEAGQIVLIKVAETFKSEKKNNNLTNDT